VLTKDGICTLVDIVIINPTRVDLLPQSCATQRFATFDATQAKKQSYCNRHPVDQFLPLVVEVFGGLHKQMDVFLHNCANAIWSLEGRNNFPLFVLVTSAKNFNHITKATNILHFKSSDSHRPSYFLTSTPLGHTISMANLLQEANF
jgi:hypothetical protein